jgi:hypothetical protein
MGLTSDFRKAPVDGNAGTWGGESWTSQIYHSSFATSIESSAICIEDEQRCADQKYFAIDQRHDIEHLTAASDVSVPL